MKKLALTALFACAGVATAAPYVLPENQPGALTEYDCHPVYSLEGIVSFNNKSMPDTYGVRAAFSLYSSGSGSVLHQFGINAAPQWGSETKNDTHYSVFVLPVTASYDLNIGLTDDLYLDFGAKAGYSWMDVDIRDYGSGNIGGFTYSVGAGLKYKFSDTVWGKVGYELGRTYYSKSGVKENVTSHMIVVGIGCTF